jgi:CRP/FNR family transcriptional regulator, cyclic AMP receptor protein
MGVQLNHDLILDLNEQSWNQVRNHPAFHGMHEVEIKRILPYFRLIEATQGSLIVKEGMNEPIRLFYIVLNGKLEVLKNAADIEMGDRTGIHLEQFIIATLTSGDIFGELSFVRNEAKSASIRCMIRSQLLVIDQKGLEQIEQKHPQLACCLLKNLIGIVSSRLKYTSDAEVNGLKVSLSNSILNSKANLFFSYVIGLLCVYNLVLQIIIEWSRDDQLTSVISACIIGVFGGTLFLMIYKSKLPVKLFGLTLENWKPAVKDSMKWTVIVIILLIFVKWILIQNVSQYATLSLFNFTFTDKNYLIFNFLLYGFHSPIQEFVARGVLQGSMQHFFTGRNIKFRAIVGSNALFAATHVHLMNGWLGLIVFFPGLFWGWLYSKNENLIGVSISHMLIGWTALFFLDVGALFING